MIYSSNEPFADWLDVTCHPDQSFMDSISRFLGLDHHFVLKHKNDERSIYEAPKGKVVLDYKKRFHRASFSGAVLALLRKLNLLDDLLFTLSEVPHKVTRLDVAADYPVDGPLFLRALEKKFPTDQVSLTRKAQKVTRMYSARESDGQLTGTWYVGHRSSSRVTARVYDKIQQLIDVHSAEPSSLSERYPRGLTRVELTFRKDHGCTLKDCSMPKSLFYEYASPTLVERPDDLPSWEPNDMIGWSGNPIDTSITMARFRTKLDHSPELAQIADLASEFGPAGLETVMNAFRVHLQKSLNTHYSDEECA